MPASPFAGFLDAWSLLPDGEVRRGRCAEVLPVLTSAGEPAALKVGRVDVETELEHLALQHWAGDGAVRLLRADPRRGALLLERLGPEDLTDHWDVDACEIVAGLYARLHRPAGPQYRRLSDLCVGWMDQLRALPRDAPLPRRFVEQTLAALTTFVDDPDTDGRLIHTDLHYENVLAHPDAGGREPWLAIDPKPLSGDPHYEVAPLLWNRYEELADSPGGVGAGVRSRFFAVIDAAGLDEERARAWAVVRMVLNAAWESAEREPDRDWITRCVSVAKAVGT